MKGLYVPTASAMHDIKSRPTRSAALAASAAHASGTSTVRSRCCRRIGTMGIEPLAPASRRRPCLQLLLEPGPSGHQDPPMVPAPGDEARCRWPAEAADSEVRDGLRMGCRRLSLRVAERGVQTLGKPAPGGAGPLPQQL